MHASESALRAGNSAQVAPAKKTRRAHQILSARAKVRDVASPNWREAAGEGAVLTLVVESAAAAPVETAALATATAMTFATVLDPLALVPAPIQARRPRSCSSA